MKLFCKGRKEKRYKKTDLLGFYSFDYIQESRSTISFQFMFKDGYRLDISDVLFLLVKPSSYPNACQRLSSGRGASTQTVSFETG